VRTEQLRSLGIEAEVLAMSGEMGVAKPDPAFFTRALELMGEPPPGSVAYVGDRIDNDVVPAAAAGMRAVWIRRGPWGVIQQPPAGVDPALVVDSLDELAARIGEAWS
jgi:FMN phosphatase YigB (HAD superfamily)